MSSVCGKPTGVGSNWKRSVVPKDPGKPARKKRISPSKARRNATSLQAFLVKKNVESHDTREVFDSSTQASQSLDGKYVDSHVSQQCRPDSREEDRGSDERNEHVVVEDRDKRIRGHLQTKVVVYPSYNDIHDIFLSEISSQRSRH